VRANRSGAELSDDANVIFLAFSKPETAEPDTMAFIACRTCHNKTYTLTEDRPGTFPLLRFSAAALAASTWAELAGLLMSAKMTRTRWRHER
jgi:5-methylcytosine-specific restriction endonuclease McrA